MHHQKGEQEMTQISFRIEDDLKTEADYILDRIGMSMSSALGIFIRQLIVHRGIPFEVRIPDDSLASPARIQQAMRDFDNGRRNYSYHELPGDIDDEDVGRVSSHRRTRRAKALV
jgi:DNA-damage-inducible protein J